jgi:hypothetical protein
LPKYAKDDRAISIAMAIMVLAGSREKSDCPKYTYAKVPGIIPKRVPQKNTPNRIRVKASTMERIVNGISGIRRKITTLEKLFFSITLLYDSIRVHSFSSINLETKLSPRYLDTRKVMEAPITAPITV